MNQVILIGRLTKDCELSYTPNTQTAACRITLAVDRPKRNGDAQGNDYVRSADFIRVTVWGRQAETCDRYLSKGRQIAVMGRIQTGSYKNRNGETVYTTDVVAERVEFLGGGQQQSQPQVNTDEVQRQADELLRPKQNNAFNTGSGEKSYLDPEMAASYGSKQTNTQMQMESQLASGFDDLPDTFMAAEDDIPF